MKVRFPFDDDDPFGSRPDEKPPEGWDRSFWEDVCERIDARRDEPGSHLPPASPRRRGPAIHVALVILLASAAVALWVGSPARPRALDPSAAFAGMTGSLDPLVRAADPTATFVVVNGSREPDVVVEWARADGRASGYVVLESIDPAVSYLLIEQRLTRD